MITPPQPSRLPVYDWPRALHHVGQISEQIQASARISPQGAENTIICHVRPLEHRYVAGERSAELYEAMLGLRFREGV